MLFLLLFLLLSSYPKVGITQKSIRSLSIIYKIKLKANALVLKCTFYDSFHSSFMGYFFEKTWPVVNFKDGGGYNILG